MGAAEPLFLVFSSLFVVGDRFSRRSTLVPRRLQLSVETPHKDQIRRWKFTESFRPPQRRDGSGGPNLQKPQNPLAAVRRSLLRQGSGAPQ